MAEKELEAKPLHQAATDRLRSDEEDPTSRCPPSRKPHLHKRGLIICCGCCTAMALLLAVLVLVLTLTLFRIRDPEMTMNSVTIIGMSSPQRPPASSLNVTLAADISCKNPNAASFDYGNGTAVISYDKRTIGEARIPAGKARARRTVRMNVTVDVVITSAILGDEKLFKDVLSGNVTVDSYTTISGRVRFMNIFKRHAVVVMNCTISMSVWSQTILEQKCKRRVDL